MQFMRFKMERRAPYALAVQIASIGAGLALLAVQQFYSSPHPALCDGAAQIVYDSGRTCHAGLDGMFRALAAPQPGFVRAIYVRPSGADSPTAWLDAGKAVYLWRPDTAAGPGALAAYAAIAPAQAAQQAGGGQLLRYRDVVEHTVRLVTKD